MFEYKKRMSMGETRFEILISSPAVFINDIVVELVGMLLEASGLYWKGFEIHLTAFCFIS